MIYHGIKKPLYLQMRDMLVEQIESGELSPGDSLPGERKLAEMYDVSRVVIRKCIALMVEEGYLVRNRGKNTTVADPKVSHRLGELIGIAEELYEADNTIEVKVLSKGYTKMTSDVKKYLKPDDDDSKMYEFSRLVLRDNQPIVLNYSYVVPSIGRLVETLDLKNDKVFQYLENCGYNISYAEQVISAGICNRTEARLLDYNVGYSTLVIKRTSFLENGYPILYEKSIYRGDKYQYSIKLLRKLKGS